MEHSHDADDFPISGDTGRRVVDGPPRGTLPAAAADPIKKIVIVVLENTAESEAVKMPYLATLAKRGALLSNDHAEVHPSQPNYIAMIAGSSYGVEDRLNGDGRVTLDRRHIGDLLEEHGLTWKVYAEDYPGHCFLGPSSGLYARKHVPFLSFKNVQTDPARCAKIVDAATFDGDVQSGSLPAFSLYIPNLRNDGHDGPDRLVNANAWMQKTFDQKLLGNKDAMKNLLFIVTFDEGSGGSRHKRSRIATILVGDAVRPGSELADDYNHFSLLKLVEDTLMPPGARQPQAEQSRAKGRDRQADQRNLGAVGRRAE